MERRHYFGAAIITSLIVMFGFSHCARAESVDGSAVEVVLPSGHGSGVYLGNGYVLTAAHVAVAADADGKVSVKRPRAGGWTDDWSAKVVWVDTWRDFALLKLNATPPEHLAAAHVSCEAPQLGDDVTIVGWPINLGEITSRGYVAGEESKRGSWEVSYVVVAPIFFGNSGGPVYGKDGRVVALAVGIVPGTSLSIVIPTSTVCPFLPPEAKS